MQDDPVHHQMGLRDRVDGSESWDTAHKGRTSTGAATSQRDTLSSYLSGRT